MKAIIKTQKFWLISNFVGMIIYLFVASMTWNLDFHLNGLFPEYGILNLLLPLFIVFNLIWLILIIFRFQYPNSFQKLVLLATVAAFWAGIIAIEIHVDNYWHEQAQKELNEHN
jgi:hypothetical protein